MMLLTSITAELVKANTVSWEVAKWFSLLCRWRGGRKYKSALQVSNYLSLTFSGI